MIAQLKGIVAAVERDAVVLDAGGIGFRVFVPSSTRASIGRPGDEARLLTVMIVREDAVTLYGFESEEERSLFNMLQDVSGIGPKTALAMLSVLSPDRLLLAISTGDTRTLSTAPGVGKRTAERLALELRDKVGAIMRPDALEEREVAGGLGDAHGDAVRGLVALGYTVVEADRAVRAVLRDKPSDQPAAIIKAALSRLARAE
ncbi:MAG: Holliday junction branch migration protein RuvA [Firmicutes bacterium]|jgi:Holliday junction DNA helicase RuvA|nr:Holliday junction branch migration protein RuvA [Bacillota bacterium]